MKICWATIRVMDMEASLYFYHDILGLPIDTRQEGDHSNIVFLGEANEPKIELLLLKDQPPAKVGDTLSIGFTVDSLDDTLQLMKDNNVPIASGPVAPSAFLRFFFVNDPSGILVQFVEQRPM